MVACSASHLPSEVEPRHLEKRSPLVPFLFPLAKKPVKKTPLLLGKPFALKGPLLLGKPFALAGAPKLLKKAPGPLKKLGPKALLAGGTGVGGSALTSLPTSLPAKPAIGGLSSSPAIPDVGALKGKGGLLKKLRRKGSIGRGSGSSKGNSGRSNQSRGSHRRVSQSGRSHRRGNQSGGRQRKNSHSKEEEDKNAAAEEDVTTRAPTEEEKEAALQAQAAMGEAQAAIEEAQATMQEALAAMAALRGLPVDPLDVPLGRK